MHSLIMIRYLLNIIKLIRKHWIVWY